MGSSSAMILPMSFSTKDEYTQCLFFGQRQVRRKRLSCFEKDSEHHFPQTSDGFDILHPNISGTEFDDGVSQE